MAASLRTPGGFFDEQNQILNSHSPVKSQWKNKNKNKIIEIKHDICSRLNVMFENYMVST